MTKDFLEGRWQFVRYDHSVLIYKNIYNNNELRLSGKQVKDVLEYRTTIGKIMCRRTVYAKPSRKNIIERRFDDCILGGVENGWCSPTVIRWQKLKGKYRKNKIK